MSGSVNASIAILLGLLRLCEVLESFWCTGLERVLFKRLADRALQVNDARRLLAQAPLSDRSSALCPGLNG